MPKFSASTLQTSRTATTRPHQDNPHEPKPMANLSMDSGRGTGLTGWFRDRILNLKECGLFGHKMDFLERRHRLLSNGASKEVHPIIDVADVATHKCHPFLKNN